MYKLKWGVLSTAKIAVQHVLPAMKRASNTEILGISSRSAEKAEEAARKLGISRSYESYEAMLSDPDIDAVYNPLPNHLHLEWTLKALQAGKHVLCEKPLGMNAGQVRELAEEAATYPNLLVAEAFMYRHHPMWAYIAKQVKSGIIGRVQMIQSHFSYYNANSDDIRNNPEMGGGGLLDIGCYCVSSARLVMGREPSRVVAAQVRDPQFGTDRITSGILDFGDATAVFSCGTYANLWQGMVITGEKGRIEIPIPWNPPHEKQAQVHVYAQGRHQIFQAPVCNHFALQAEAFARAVSGAEPPVVSLAESEANMTVLDALTVSAKTGSWKNL